VFSIYVMFLIVGDTMKRAVTLKLGRRALSPPPPRKAITSFDATANARPQACRHRASLNPERGCEPAAVP